LEGLSPRTSRAVLFACIPLYGHLRPLIQQARELSERGHRVAIASTEEARGHVEGVRRGGPSLHKVHGEAIAINAGCSAYFLALAPLLRDGLSDFELARIYEGYLQAMRAAHAGQALDIHGLEHLMPEVLETGAGAILEERILAVHRLKSGVGPGALARVAALVGGGTE
jgi:hypothetical protein